MEQDYKQIRKRFRFRVRMCQHAVYRRVKTESNIKYVECHAVGCDGSAKTAAAATRRKKLRLQQRQRQHHQCRTRQCLIHQPERNPAKCVRWHHAMGVRVGAVCTHTFLWKLRSTSSYECCFFIIVHCCLSFDMLWLLFGQK